MYGQKMSIFIVKCQGKPKDYWTVMKSLPEVVLYACCIPSLRCSSGAGRVPGTEGSQTASTVALLPGTSATQPVRPPTGCQPSPCRMAGVTWVLYCIPPTCAADMRQAPAVCLQMLVCRQHAVRYRLLRRKAKAAGDQTAPLPLREPHTAAGCCLAKEADCLQARGASTCALAPQLCSTGHGRP